MSGFTIKDNTVSAVNQVNKSESLYCLGNEKSNKKILILGNSITRHGVCKEIGWENDWGMSASSREKDYVHLLYNKLGNDYFFTVKQASYWERNYKQKNILNDEYSNEKEFDADIVIFNLGENVKDVTDDESQLLFSEKLNEMIDYFISGGAKFILTTCVWKNDLVDKAIIGISKSRGINLVDLNCIGNDESNLSIGKFWHSGVAGHPGDKGMEKIAELLYEEITR